MNDNLSSEEEAKLMFPEEPGDNGETASAALSCFGLPPPRDASALDVAMGITTLDGGTLSSWRQSEQALPIFTTALSHMRDGTFLLCGLMSRNMRDLFICRENIVAVFGIHTTQFSCIMLSSSFLKMLLQKYI